MEMDKRKTIVQSPEKIQRMAALAVKTTLDHIEIAEREERSMSKDEQSEAFYRKGVTDALGWVGGGISSAVFELRVIAPLGRTPDRAGSTKQDDGRV